MILLTIAGWALEHFAGIGEATVLGLLLGLFAAQLVPLGRPPAC